MIDIVRGMMYYMKQENYYVYRLLDSLNDTLVATVICIDITFHSIKGVF